MKRIFLDWASTAPPLAAAVEAQKKAMTTQFGNPSSLHREGREAKAALEEARSLIAQAAGALPEEVVFTSGATEANNIIAASVLKRQSLSPSAAAGRRVIVSGVEHASLWEPAQALGKMGSDVAVLAPDRSGIVRPEALKDLLDEKTALVAIMLVNNETGAIQPVAECAAVVREFSRRQGLKIHFHTDAVQAFGKTLFDFHGLGADSAALSAHKLGGPRGAGALLVRKTARLEYLYLGGGHESNRRPGTENLAALAGFAQSAKHRISNFHTDFARAVGLSALFIRSLASVPGVSLLPRDRAEDDGRRFSPYIVALAAPPIPGEVLVRRLDEQGFAVSTGSACHSSKSEHTRVIEAQGEPKAVAASVIRVSLGPETEEREIEALVSALRQTVPLLLKITKKKH